jgi:xanthine dehydrogenase YagT iron-sulfur-binding subunit
MEGEKLGAVQEAFHEKDGYQCGFCTPGQVMAAYALLLKNKQPEVDEIKYGMSGNLCRCAAYPKIIDSVQAASEKMGA